MTLIHQMNFLVIRTFLRKYTREPRKMKQFLLLLRADGGFMKAESVREGYPFTGSRFCLRSPQSAHIC